MNRPSRDSRAAARDRHDGQFRDPADLAGFWRGAVETDPSLFACETEGRWWETLRRCGVTLLVSREYEHLLLGLTASDDGTGAATYLRLPHPSGIAVDEARATVHVACTRNPNQVYDLQPVRSLMPRLDRAAETFAGNPLLPARVRFLPGCTYLHDLALIGGELHATSVGQNAIVRIGEGGACERVWWPRCIEAPGGPVFGRNHIQLNSIAAGACPADSYYSASADEMTELRPGDPAFPVDRRGVIFSGATREALALGLTRPHSARLHGGRIWVDNSGYGEVGVVEGGAFVSVRRLPGWTRGLAFCGDTAFVGTSRVLPRFRAYAPGLDPAAARCGVHAVDVRTGEALGSIVWPAGNQIFAIEPVPSSMSGGFPFAAGEKQARGSSEGLFYAFDFTTP
ncbi:MAG: DUF4915 domain-containing protein [Candidatus Aureabacteria bacterium]|nr:DUF4915 domain-containing protein [Candidatus Auribacterota bacterium]